MTTMKKYRKRLIFELRLRDVPGDVIGDTVAQVESHVADTGEDPETAFGSPPEYAESFGNERSVPRRWPLFVLNWILGFVFGLMLIVGIAEQTRGNDLWWGVSPMVAIVLGGVGLLAYAVLVVVVWADRVRDPRKAR